MATAIPILMALLMTMPTSSPMRKGAMVATRNVMENDGGRTMGGVRLFELMNLCAREGRWRGGFASHSESGFATLELSLICTLADGGGKLPEEPMIDVTKVSDKGQVVIPKEIRDRLGFVEGSRLIVVATEDAVVLQKVETIAGKVRMRDLLDRVKSLTDRLGFGRT